MQIYVVKPGDTLFSIGRALGLAPGFLARYNGLQEPYRLAVGQSLLALYPEETVTVQPGDTLTSIAADAGTDVLSLYRMNPNLSGSDRIYPGQILVTRLEQTVRRPAVVSGYAYPNVSERVLRGILPYAGALAPFTYGFTPEGALVPMDDARLLTLAKAFGTQPLLHLSTLTAAGTFSAAQAAALLQDPALQQTLAAAVLQTMQEKGYEGLDVDFEYLGRDLAEPYAAFIQLLHDTLAPYSLPLITALAPKTSADQPGTLYEGHNYAALASASDAVLLMTYGYTQFAHTPEYLENQGENERQYPTLEMADNAVSRYIAQKGKCAVTHEPLSVMDMVCLHIKPPCGSRNDTYKNLILLSSDATNLVTTSNESVIRRSVSRLTLSNEMQNKINKLREHRSLATLQFEDYTGTKK